MVTRPILSAVREAKKQLFLDRAEGKYLSDLSANLGFERPIFGFSNDDLWRAIVRRCAMDYRQVEQVFRDILTLVIGPEKTSYTVLSADTSVSDYECSIADWNRVPQIGLFVIDENTSNEELIIYDFRDPRSGLVSLDSLLTKNHTAVGTNVSCELKVASSIGDSSLVLWDSGDLPTADFPYTIIIDPGLPTEESNTLTSNTVATNTIGLGTPLIYAHKAPESTQVTSDLTFIDPSKTVISLRDSSKFPLAGSLRISVTSGSPTTELVRYDHNDIVTNTIQLNSELTGTYVTTSYATMAALVRPGATIALAQVQVKGGNWNVWVTEPNKVKILVPHEFIRNRMQDVGWLHEDGTVSASTLLTSSYSIGTTFLQCTTQDLQDFPESGELILDSGGPNEETISYGRNGSLSYTQLYASYSGSVVGGSWVPGAPIPTGTTTLYVESAAVLAAFDKKNPLKQLTLGYDTANHEVVTYSSIDVENNTVTLSSPTTKDHTYAGSGKVHPFAYPDTFYLLRHTTRVHVLGETVSYVRPMYSNGYDDSLQDGSVGVAGAFQGPYLVDFNKDAPTSAWSTLNTNVSGPQKLAVDSVHDSGIIEVKDASYFQNSGDFSVHLRGGGFDQVIDTLSVSLASDSLGDVISAPASAGGTTVSTASIGNFPVSLTVPYGYRIMLDAGTASAEVVEVASISGTTITLTSALTKNHLINSSINLINDVVVLNGTLNFDFPGFVTRAQKFLVWPGPLTLYDSVTTVSERRTCLQISSTSGFSSDDSTAIINFSSVNSETVSYNGTSGSDPAFLVITDGVEMKNSYAALTQVIQSGIKSFPEGKGIEHLFYLPGSWEQRLLYLFDKVRAAGVQVEIFTNDNVGM
jgi:hypothetical protein